MKDPTPNAPLAATPTFETDEEMADFQALFNRPAYDPAAALAKARAVFPAGFDPDTHWLAWALICANISEWMLSYVDLNKRRLDYRGIEGRYGILSSGERALAVLALHLLNDVHLLSKDGLTDLRLLDDWHFELAMHAIRLHSRGAR